MDRNSIDEGDQMKGVTEAKMEDLDDEQAMLMMMGFQGFDSTKVIQSDLNE